ncbi:MAG: hypothetical protein LUD17_06680 [Bacteroidales bacterium]|nr:hypothetical protein [Bacteroidales bacterium]
MAIWNIHTEKIAPMAIVAAFSFTSAVYSSLDNRGFAYTSNPIDERIEYLNIVQWDGQIDHIDPVKAELLARLEELCQLRDGWNGGDGFAMEEDSIKNVRVIIDNLSPNILSRWILFPNTNGTFLFTLDSDIPASISVANNTYSFVAFTKDNKLLKGRGEFDLDNLGKIFEEITNV